MRSKLPSILAATLGLALAFTFSCSFLENLDGDKSSSSGGGSSSSGDSNYETKIGNQTWLKHNLNVETAEGKGNSVCNKNETANCDIYGRLYDWAGAMALPSDCNSSSCASQINTKHRGICPEGFHIPTGEEWDALTSAAGGSSTAGRYLKAQSGWNNCGPSGSGNSYVCEDAYGFSALPGGWRVSASFMGIGSSGDWWTASEVSATSARWRSMDNSSGSIQSGSKSKSSEWYSVRCVKDN
jgi:uncharacterized protein (TIGR02145 family)